MATKTLITEEEYLATGFEWEPEYRDGEIIERPTPNTKHSTTQTLLAVHFCHSVHGFR